MQQVSITNQTFKRLLELAQVSGFGTVSEYLEKLANEGPDDFVMTPQVSAALDEGLEDIRAGRTVTMKEAKSNLEAVKKQWRASKAV